MAWLDERNVDDVPVNNNNNNNHTSNWTKVYVDFTSILILRTPIDGLNWN